MLIRPATLDEIPEVAALFREYQAEIDIDLCFQSFEEEVSGLPGVYAPPNGTLLLAFEPPSSYAGCVALRPKYESEGEIKRLYVRPSWRGTGLGRQLAQAVIHHARGMGYKSLVLDTLRTMREATALYTSLGFEETDPYYANPLEGVLYFRLPIG